MTVTFRLVATLLMMLALSLSVGAWQGKLVLDLTDAIPKDAEKMKEFLQESKATSHGDPLSFLLSYRIYGPLTEHPEEVPYVLPLELRLISAIPIDVGGGERKFLVEVSIMNKGKIPYLLPTSVDFTRSTMLLPNSGRKSVTLQVDFRNVETGKPARKSSAVAGSIPLDGSMSVPSSFLSVGSGESVLVRYSIPLNSAWVNGIKDPVVAVRAVVVETKLTDGTYTVTEYSQPSSSQPMQVAIH